MNFTTRAKKVPFWFCIISGNKNQEGAWEKPLIFYFHFMSGLKIPNVNFAESYFFGLAKRSFLQARTWPLNLIYENLFLVRSSVKDLYILSKEKINHHFLEVVWASVKIIISNKHFLKKKWLQILQKILDFQRKMMIFQNGRFLQNFLQCALDWRFFLFFQFSLFTDCT